MADFTPIGVDAIIRGLGSFESGMGRMNNLIQQSGSFASGSSAGFLGMTKSLSGMTSAATLAGGAVLYIGAAAGAAAVKTVAKFAELDQGMREVWTLLPTYSKDALDKMTNDVQSFSNRVGKLTSETVPALYQAISAGVPDKNVFQFFPN